MAPKNHPKWCETTTKILYPFRTPLLQLAILDPHIDHSTPVVVIHRFPVFYLNLTKNLGCVQRKCVLLEGDGLSISHMVAKLQSSVGKLNHRIGASQIN